MNFPKIFKQSKLLAVIGCSNTPGRAGHDIPKMMRQNGFTVIPVNPNIDSVFGKTAFPSMLDVPTEIEIDIVVIFRNPRYSAKAVADTVKWVQKSNRKPLIWTQLGVSTAESKEIAENAGLDYVENACIAVEYAKYGR